MAVSLPPARATIITREALATSIAAAPRTALMNATASDTNPGRCAAASSYGRCRKASTGSHQTSRRRRNRRLLRSSSSAGRLMQPAEKPDEKDDRKGNSNQPEQKAATHSVSSVGVCALRTSRAKLGSRELNGSCIGRRRDEPPDIVEDGTANRTKQPADAGNILAGLRVLNLRLACSDRCRFLRRQLHATGPRRARHSPCVGLRWPGRRIASAPERRGRGTSVEG